MDVPEDVFNDGRVELFQQLLWQVELPQLAKEVQPRLGPFRHGLNVIVPLQVLRNCGAQESECNHQCSWWWVGGERRWVGGSKPTVKLIKNAKNALRKLYCTISEQQTNNPDGFFIIAGDFNQANLKTVLPKFIQQWKMHTKLNPAPTSGTRTTSLLC